MDILFDALADIVLIALGYIVYRELEKRIQEASIDQEKFLYQQFQEIRTGLRLQAEIDERLLARLERMESRLTLVPLSRSKRIRRLVADEQETDAPQIEGEQSQTEEIVLPS